MSSWLYEVGRWCFGHRGRVVIAWLVLLALVGGGAALVMRPMDDSFRIPGASSQAAYDQLRMTFPEAADAGATMIVTLPAGRDVADADVRKAIEGGIAEFEREPFVVGSISPYSEYLKGRISADGRSALVGLRLSGSVSTITDGQRETLQLDASRLKGALPPGTTVLMGGDVFATSMPHLSAIEAVGVAVALVVLVAVLGSLLAGLVPLATALLGVGLGMAVVFGATGFAEISSTTPMLALMLGLAVGIDYALFILSRHRDQLAHGLEVAESGARAVATAGSAVVFAGLTVIIALIGLSVANIPFLTVMGAYAAVSVGIGVVVALTLLPAVMGFLGERMRPRGPAAEPPHGERRGGGVWGWWVRMVTRVPLLTVAVVIIGLGAVAYPAKDLWLSLPNAGQLPASEPARQTYDAITREFGPGFNGPLVVTMQLVESTDPLGVVAGMKADIETIPGVELVAVATPNQNADTGMIHVIPTTGPDDPRTETVVDAIRAKVPEWQDRYHTTAAVTGMTAVGLDITQRLTGALLPFGIFVVGLSLVLLTMVFRSIAVPIKAAFGYLLSIGAAFGATTLVFNKGWFKEVVNLHETTAVISFFPIITMGILFGLAMDYEVFLVSRMREEHVHGDDARQAVHDGFVHSAKVVAAAAVIMFAVFAFFVPNGEGAIKPIAFGLAIGVAIDAFVVRMTLVPAVMHLLGEKAWWLPGWLDRLLPSLDVEGESLARQFALADWPAPGDPHLVYGEGVGIGDAPRAGDDAGFDLLAGLDLAVLPGRVLVVSGPADRRASVLLTLSGRMAPSAGRLKVLGHVLPDAGAKVRTASVVVDPHSRQLAAILDRTTARLVLVDDADHLHGPEREALAGLLQRRDGRVIVLSCARADSVRDLISQDDLVLRLDAPVGATMGGDTP